MNSLTLFGLSAVLHAYVALRLIPDLAAFPAAGLLLAAVLLASTLLIPMGLMARRIARPPLADRLGWLAVHGPVFDADGADTAA